VCVWDAEFGGRNPQVALLMRIEKVRHPGIKQCQNFYRGTVGLSYFGVGDWFAKRTSGEREGRGGMGRGFGG
jgi:hypothetical protein